MKEINLICVGKLKDKNLEAIEGDYLKRIKNPALFIYEVKASAEDKETEGREILKKIEDISKGAWSHIILLTEHGKTFSSPQFSQMLYDKIENYNNLFFVICGAEGPSEELKLKSHEKLSLSPLTFAHKLARIIFVEQIYRAQSIKEGHPYHK